jgi:hypothetical protein
MVAGICVVEMLGPWARVPIAVLLRVVLTGVVAGWGILRS